MSMSQPFLQQSPYHLIKLPWTSVEVLYTCSIQQVSWYGRCPYKVTILNHRYFFHKHESHSTDTFTNTSQHSNRCLSHHERQSSLPEAWYYTVAALSTVLLLGLGRKPQKSSQTQVNTPMKASHIIMNDNPLFLKHGITLLQLFQLFCC